MLSAERARGEYRTVGSAKRDFLIPSSKKDNDTDFYLDSGPYFFYLLFNVILLILVIVSLMR